MPFAIAIIAKTRHARPVLSFVKFHVFRGWSFSFLDQKNSKTAPPIVVVEELLTETFFREHPDEDLSKVKEPTYAQACPYYF